MTLTPAERAEFDARQKAKRKTCWGKKAKKDLVHLAPLNPSLKGKNVIIFTDAEIQNEVGNPIDVESRESLFLPNPQGNYNHEDVKVNPRHPRAQFYQLLMDSYAQDWSVKHFKWTIINLYLDAPSDSEQDLSNEEVGHSPQLFTPPRDEETVKDHSEDYKLDGQHNSHMDDDYGYWRYVSNFDINTVADCQQLLVALGSLSSSVEQYMLHSANCVKCRTNKRQDLIELLADSSTSLNFTHERSDLSEFQEVHDDDFDV